MMSTNLDDDEETLTARITRLGLLSMLADRPTIFLKKPLIAEFLYQKKPPARAKTPEEIAEEIIKERWGKKLASGIFDRMIKEVEAMGVEIDPKMVETLKEAWARVVTKGLMK